MARYIYEWKPTEQGRRLFRRPSATTAARAPKVEPVNYGALLKPELIEQADKRGIDSSGTKAEIIERLEAADGD